MLENQSWFYKYLESEMDCKHIISIKFGQIR